METLLVTGASGFLGRYLLIHGDRSYDVVGTEFTSSIQTDAGTAVQVDLTDPPFPSLERQNPDHIIHCAGLTDVDECERNPERAHRLNVEMTESVAEFAASTDANLVYLSTDALFDGSRPFWSEDDQPNPINVYGETKYAAERAAKHIHDDVTVVRTNFFGWTPSDQSSLAEWMLDTLTSGEELTGFEDVFFTPLYAGDVADSLLKLLECDCPETLHLGGSERVSKLEFARNVAAVFDQDESLITPITVSDLDLDAPRPRDLSLDTSRAERLLSEHFPDIQTGLQRMKAERDS